MVRRASVAPVQSPPNANPLSEELPDIKVTCPFCGIQVDTALVKCPRCGVPLKPQEFLECPECGTRAPEGSKSCPKCGVEFAEEVSAPVPAPVIPLATVQPIKTKIELPARVIEPPRTTEVIRPIPPRVVPPSAGLTNGRGAVNGTSLQGARGAINGTGLVNGTGMTNGTKMEAGAGQASRSRRRKSIVTRWQFLAVLVALIIVIPTFLLLSYSRPEGPAVDGDFGEWAKVTKFDMNSPAASADLEVQEWAVENFDGRLYSYIKVAGAMMGSTGVDSFYLFVDEDDSSRTGYYVSGIGAEYVLEFDGWEGQVKSASMKEYSSDDQNDWSAWSDPVSISVATSSSQLEAMADLPVALTSEARYLLLSQDNLPDQTVSLSYPVPESGGVLILKLVPSATTAASGFIPSSPVVSFADLIMTCEGESGTISSIEPGVTGATSVSQIGEISLSPGASKIAQVLVDTSESPASILVSATIAESGVTSTFSDIIILGDPVKAYVASVPALITIDGAFGDWSGKLLADDDADPILNSNINMTQVASANATTTSAFYVEVRGEVFHGTFVPSMNGKPSGAGGGGGGAVTPARKSGEDILRIYIDSDQSNASGLLVSRSTKMIGADYLIEIKGTNGKVMSSALLVYGPSGWTATTSGVVQGKDDQRLEVGVLTSAIGGGASFDCIIETTDWLGEKDWAKAGGLLDPWVIDSAGNTYMTNDGLTWTYLGTPTLEPGDHIVDLTMDQDKAQVHIMTNTGRTYFWEIGVSTAWTAGETIPIDVVTYSEAVSLTFYSKTGAYLLTKNGSFFYLMNVANPGIKEWKYYGLVESGVTDCTDIVYTKAGGSAYALRSGVNTHLPYAANGNAFNSFTSPTGSTSVQTDLAVIGSASNATERLFVLCEDGKIRYSSNGGVSWSALGDLPRPNGPNQTKYVSMGFDSTGYLWIATDTGYCFKSTDATTYSSFTYVGESPISGVIAIVPLPGVIPEFGMVLLPVVGIIGVVLIGRSRRLKR